MRFILLDLIRPTPLPVWAGAWLVLILAALAFPGYAETPPDEPVYYVADIELQSDDELIQLLDRAGQILMQEGPLPPVDAGSGALVTLVLHGPVLKSLLRENYRDNRALVDRAASLSALGVIDVKACKSWMTYNEINPEQLHPFIEVVAYGPAEVERLVKDRGYLYF